MHIDHPPILESRQLQWLDEAACAAWARQLAGRAGINQAFIELAGPLGAGKTTWVRHLLRALGVAGRIKSPTYTVMEPYTLADGHEAAHFDFYRFSDPREWLDAGFRDVFARPGLKIAEWRVLAVLAEADGLTPGELGQRTEMDKMTVSRATAALGERGLVRREGRGDDRRSHRLALTPAGTALHAEVAPLALAMEAQLLDGMGVAELAALRATLARLKTATARLTR